MVGGILLALGGLGLFLLGMAVMTDGLKSLAQLRIRGLLAQSTRNPTRGAVTGAISTAIIQSSSATTVAAVGFVSAGLLSFPEALGIIFGANIGTTITGWMVALLGFKLRLGQAVLPLILVGVLMHLFGSGRIRSSGFAIAGFGLVFVGIATLQEGMQTFSDVVTPQSFPSDTIAGRTLLVLLGMAVTVVTQSSSAGVAMAITAVNTGNISLPQAAAMVIGMDVGTTATALLATIGGKVQARRTGAAHVVYNILTGIGAFALLTPYMWALDALLPTIRDSDAEIALVAFHSLFNLVGVVVVLPFTSRFASLIVRLVPERGNHLTSRLDPQLQQTPELAVAAVQATVCDLIAVVFQRLVAVLSGNSGEDVDHEAVDEALRQTERYLKFVRVTPDQQGLYRRHQASYHILDHLRRLIIRVSEKERLNVVREIQEFSPYVDRLANMALQVTAAPLAIDATGSKRFRTEYRALKSREQSFRREAIARATEGETDADLVISQTDAARALRRASYHVWRIVRHLRAGFRDETIAR